MSKDIDVKALVSHLVRGDGADKCRICMGDTSEGQVYLADTVMMDGDRPVTLGELLEVITGVEVEEDAALPNGLCRECSQSAMAAIHFRQACKLSNDHWTQAAAFLSSILPPHDNDKAYYVFYNLQERTIIGDQSVRAGDKERALKRLNARFQDEIDEVDEIDIKNEKTGRKSHRATWTCPDCDKKFSSPTYLNSHLKNTLKRACEHCGLVLSKAKLPQHLSDDHGRLVFSCGVCKQVFDNPSLLEAHFNLSHAESSHHCKVCGMGFNNDRALSAHNYAHSLFYCNHCGRCFENRKCYFHHQKQCKRTSVKMAKSNQMSEYICDHCGNSYTKKPSLRIHIIQKHLHVLPYVCDTCGKRTSTIAHLRSHEKTHSLERKMFQCFCRAKFRTSLGYQLHLRIHSGEKPYQCEECGDKFLSASRRLDHVKRRHRSTKDMPHGCKECPARFVRPFELKKHYMSMHSDVIYTPEVKCRF